MIRAVLQNGLIRPLEPIPLDWVEGHQVIVEDAGSAAVEHVEEWYRQLQSLGPAVYEAGEWEEVQAVLAWADEQAKARVRREMGLD